MNMQIPCWNGSFCFVFRQFHILWIFILCSALVRFEMKSFRCEFPWSDLVAKFHEIIWSLFLLLDFKSLKNIMRRYLWCLKHENWFISLWIRKNVLIQVNKKRCQSNCGRSTISSRRKNNFQKKIYSLQSFNFKQHQRAVESFILVRMKRTHSPLTFVTIMTIPLRNSKQYIKNLDSKSNSLKRIDKITKSNWIVVVNKMFWVNWCFHWCWDWI